MKRWTHVTVSVVTVLVGAAVAGCVSGNLPPQNQGSQDGSTATDGSTGPDGGSAMDGNNATDGGSAMDGAAEGSVSMDGAPTGVDGTAASVGFSLFAAESPPGPTIAQNLWGGVLRYTLTGDNAALVAAGGIAASEVADPVGLAFRSASSEVFVGNRHGNNSGDGVAGSISRFVWNAVSQTFAPNGTITGNGLNSVCQLAFNEVSGELFASNYAGVGGISRFTFDSQGNASPNGTIGAGTAVGVNVAPDGKRLYVTVLSTTIRQFDLSSGTELTAVTIQTATRLQQIALRGSSELYVADPDNGTVYRFVLDASDNPVLKESITGADAPIGVAFSPDGLQMFTGGHLNSDIIDRYQYNAQSDTWTPTTKFTAPASLGYFMILGDAPRGVADAGSDAAHD